MVDYWLIRRSSVNVPQLSMDTHDGEYVYRGGVTPGQPGRSSPRYWPLWRSPCCPSSRPSASSRSSLGPTGAPCATWSPPSASSSAPTSMVRPSWPPLRTDPASRTRSRPTTPPRAPCHLPRRVEHGVVVPPDPRPPEGPTRRILTDNMNTTPSMTESIAEAPRAVAEPGVEIVGLTPTFGAVVRRERGVLPRRGGGDGRGADLRPALHPCDPGQVRRAPAGRSAGTPRPARRGHPQVAASIAIFMRRSYTGSEHPGPHRAAHRGPVAAGRADGALRVRAGAEHLRAGPGAG